MVLHNYMPGESGDTPVPVQNWVGQIETQYHSPAITTLAHRVDQLSRRIDYGAMLDHFDDISHPHPAGDLLVNVAREMSFLEEVRSQLTDGSFQSGGPRGTSWTSHQVDFYEDSWKTRGFLGETPAVATEAPIDKTAASEKRAELTRRANQLVEMFRNYSQLTGIFRPSFIWKNVELPAENLARVLDPNGRSADIDLEARFLEAAEAYLQKKLGRYAAMGACSGEGCVAFYNQRMKEAGGITRLAIDGLPDIKTKPLEITKAAVATFIGLSIPAPFYGKVKSITYAEAPASDAATSGETICGGVHHPIFDENGNYLGGELTVYHQNFDVQNADPAVREIAMAQMNNHYTVNTTHEIGHSAHHLLSTEEMEAWLNATRLDSTCVTWYVDHVKADLPERIREDFCESFQLFILHPALLNILSPVRFEHMKWLFSHSMSPAKFSEFMTQKQKEVDRVMEIWESNGLDKNRIREIATGQIGGKKE